MAFNKGQQSSSNWTAAVTPSRTFRAGTHIALGGLLLAFAIVVASTGFAKASPTRTAVQPRIGSEAVSAKISAARASDARTDELSDTSAIAKLPSDHQASCDRTRKRFWVEGEGWIVRRVAVCR